MGLCVLSASGERSEWSDVFEAACCMDVEKENTRSECVAMGEGRVRLDLLSFMIPFNGTGSLGLVIVLDFELVSSTRVTGRVLIVIGGSISALLFQPFVALLAVSVKVCVG